MTLVVILMTSYVTTDCALHSIVQLVHVEAMFCKP